MNDFDRIFGKRLTNAVKAMLLLKNGVRYEPTSAQVMDTFKVLEDALQELRDAYGVEVVEAADGNLSVPSTALTGDPEPTEAVSTVAPEGWKRDDIRLNVSNIPANQLSFYATHIRFQRSST